MGRIIAIANQKGGVGKTTTAINLSACLAEAGKKVLTIDLDPQGNTTSGLGIDKDELENTVYELMLDECSIKESMKKTDIENLTIIPANVNLAGAEIELLDVKEKEYVLKNSVDYIQDDFDFIIIDCPPVMVVSDAIPIGNVVDGTIFICSSKSTNRKDAKSAIEILQKNNVHIIGTVLTQVEDDGMNSKYYYYYYY